MGNKYFLDKNHTKYIQAGDITQIKWIGRYQASTKPSEAWEGHLQDVQKSNNYVPVGLVEGRWVRIYVLPAG